MEKKDYSVLKLGKQSPRALGLAKLNKPGGSYTFTIPKAWVNDYCRPDKHGNIWVQFDQENSTITIEPADFAGE